MGDALLFLFNLDLTQNSLHLIDSNGDEVFKGEGHFPPWLISIFGFLCDSTTRVSNHSHAHVSTAHPQTPTIWDTTDAAAAPATRVA